MDRYHEEQRAKEFARDFIDKYGRLPSSSDFGFESSCFRNEVSLYNITDGAERLGFNARVKIGQEKKEFESELVRITAKRFEEEDKLFRKAIF
jgi:hypothetical protein